MTTIVVVGKVDPAQAKQLVEQAFGALEGQRRRSPRSTMRRCRRTSPASCRCPTPAPARTACRWRRPSTSPATIRRAIALYLGNEVLGGGFYASRLYHDLRDKRGWSTAWTPASTWASTAAPTRCLRCRPGQGRRGARLVVQDLKQMQPAPVIETELERAKGILLRQIPLGESSFGAIGGQLLSLATEDKPLDAMTIAAEHYLKLTASEVQQAYASAHPPGWLRHRGEGAGAQGLRASAAAAGPSQAAMEGMARHGRASPCEIRCWLLLQQRAQHPGGFLVLLSASGDHVGGAFVAGTDRRPWSCPLVRCMRGDLVALHQLAPPSSISSPARRRLFLASS